MDFATFGLEADWAADDVEPTGFVDEFAIDRHGDRVSLDGDVVLIPLACRFLSSFEFGHGVELANFFAVDFFQTFSVAAERCPVERVDVARFAVLELAFDTFGQKGLGLAINAEEDAAIGRFGARRPTPFEAEIVVLVGGVGVQVAEWHARGDQHAVFGAPDVFLLEIGVDEDHRPSVEVFAVEKLGACGGGGFSLNRFAAGGDQDGGGRAGEGSEE